MKLVLNKPFRIHQFPIRDDTAMRREFSKHYLRPSDIPQEKAKQILFRLNSLNSADQLEWFTNQYTRKKLLTHRDAQRIIRTKIELGQFRNLQQVACVPRIGAEKFHSIVSMLSD